MTRPVYYEAPKQPGEIVKIAGFDFAPVMETGETISAAVVTIRQRADDVDTTATMLVPGSTTTVGSKVSFEYKLGTHNVDYYGTTEATMNTGRKIIGEVILPVRERPY